MIRTYINTAKKAFSQVHIGALLNYFAAYWSKTPVFENGLLKDNIGNNSLNPINRPCLLGDGTAYLSFTNLPTYDAITVVEDGAEISISLTSGNWTPTSGKYYNDVIFKNAGVEVARFTLEDYPAASTATMIIFADLYNAATAILMSASAANASSTDGLSRMAEKGFNIAVISDSFGGYIDSGINVRDISKIEAKIRYIGSPSSSTSTFWGAGSGGSSNALFFGHRGSTLNFSGSYLSSSVDNQATDNDVHTHVFEIDAENYDAVYSVDGNSVSITNSSGQPEDENFILFARKYNSEVLNTGAWEIQYCKIWVADVLVRHFVAQKDESLLDIINDVSYSNEGVGTFETKFIPADIVNTGEDIGGIDLNYTAGNSQGIANKYKAPVSEDFFALDIEEKFYDSEGVPKTIDFDTWTDAAYTISSQDEKGNMISLKVKKK